MHLDAVADALYALPRAEFTSARDECVKRARDSGDRELATAIGRLRRPTVAAWLVNQLARELPDEVGALAELGDALRAAHQDLDGDALRRLSRQRHELVTALVRATSGLGQRAGQDVSDAVARELEDMFTAALADAGVARAVTSGRLSSPRELDDAAAVDWPAVAPGARPRPAPAAASTPDRADRSDPALARARAELDRTAHALAEAEAAAAEARRTQDAAATEETAAHQAVADRRAELAAAELREQRTRQRARAARRDRDDADRALRHAHHRESVAARRLATLESAAPDNRPPPGQGGC